MTKIEIFVLVVAALVFFFTRFASQVWLTIVNSLIIIQTHVFLDDAQYPSPLRDHGSSQTQIENGFWPSGLCQRGYDKGGWGGVGVQCHWLS